MSGDLDAREQPLPVQPFIPGKRPRRPPGPLRRGLLKTPAWVLTLVFILPALWLLSLDLPQKPHVNWIQGLGHILLLLALYVTGALQRLKILQMLLMVALAAGMVLLHWQLGGWMLDLGLAYPFPALKPDGGILVSGMPALWFAEVCLPILLIALAEMLFRRRSSWRCVGWIVVATIAAGDLMPLAHELLYHLRWLHAPPDAFSLGKFRWYGPAFGVLRAVITWTMLPLAFRVAKAEARGRALAGVAAGSLAAAVLLFTFLPIIPPGGFTISAETTGVLGPVREDGTIDYMSALNRKYGDGVTAENNAAVSLIRAIGLSALLGDPVLCGKITDQIGMEALAEDGEYFVAIEAYLQSVVERLAPGTRPTTGQAKALQDRIDNSWRGASIPVLKERTASPWKAGDDPHVAAWLMRNEKPLVRFLSAAERPRYFVPLAANNDLPCIYAAGGTLYRSGAAMSQAVVARAMLRASEGEVDRAHAQFLALHRIARLLGQGRAEDVLVGAFVEYIACDADYALARTGKLTVAQAKAYAADLAQLTPLPEIMPALRDRRIEMQDAVLAMSRNPCLATRIDFSPPGFKDLDLTANHVDWDESLRIINEFHDKRWRFAASETFDGTRGRRAFVRDTTVWHLERSMRYSGGQHGWLVIRAHAHGPRSTRLLATDVATETFLPSHLGEICRWKLIVDRARAKTGLAIIAMALEAYRLERSAPPPKLDALVPEYLDALPQRHLGTRPASYKVKGSSYELKSTGWFYDGPEEDVTLGN